MFKHEICGKSFDMERALCKLEDTALRNCVFAGPTDGESPLKHPQNILVENCSFSLRYPLWHADRFELWKCRLDEKARAALWYCFNGKILDSVLGGIKALRDCQNILLERCLINSPEFGWKCRGITVNDSTLEAEYVFLDTQDLYLKNLKQNGKYSFQYCRDIVIENSVLDTKDAFWHSENVAGRNSVIKGEYLGWFSTNLVLENCEIEGTQPLCFAKDLILKNCTMKNTDLAFEESSVRAEIRGSVLSIKNPLSGSILADDYGEIIEEEPGRASILKRKE